MLRSLRCVDRLTIRSQTLERLSKQLVATDKPTTAPKFSFRGRSTGKSATLNSADAISRSEQGLSSLIFEPARPTTRLQRLSAIQDGAHDISGPAAIPDQAATSASSFSRLEGCIVDLRTQTLPALYLTDISRCLILAPSVAGSVLLHGVSDSVLYVGSHQVRFRLDPQKCTR